MNSALILAGGVGTRLGADRPKQFLEVGNKPIISYCLEIFQKHSDIDNIFIVAAPQWREYIKEQLELCGINKFAAFADPGKTRQHSIYSGLKAIDAYKEDCDIVIIHDAARPLVSDKIIADCIAGAKTNDGAMPVISVKDTIYQSEDSKHIDSLLKRSQLFAGQAPESFKFKRYFEIHNSVTDSEIENTAGSSEIAYRHKMDILLVQGSEQNYKITTKEDLSSFETYINRG